MVKQRKPLTGEQLELARERIRLRICAAERQRWRCYWCGDRMTGARKHRPNSVTLEHLIPSWMGGEDSEENTCAACLECNNARGAALTPPLPKHLRYANPAR